MTKTSQDNNFNYINFLKQVHMPHFKGFAMMNLLLLQACTTMYCFCTHMQSLIELESIILATTPYFEHTAPLTYSLCPILTKEGYFLSRDKA